MTGTLQAKSGLSGLNVGIDKFYIDRSTELKKILIRGPVYATVTAVYGARLSQTVNSVPRFTSSTEYFRVSLDGCSAEPYNDYTKVPDPTAKVGELL